MKDSAPNRAEVFGVTGFIGSGKSKVSRFLAMRLACPHLDADKIAGDLMETGQQGWLAIKNYDSKYIMADGRLDRVLLRNDIFLEPGVKEVVDSLIHPMVRDKLVEIVRTEPEARFVVEVPLLFEAGWIDIFDRVILVYADRNVCLQRVIKRDKVGIEQAEQAYQSQMGAGEKIKKANHIINNSGSWLDTQLQLLHLADILND